MLTCCMYESNMLTLLILRSVMHRLYGDLVSGSRLLLPLLLLLFFLLLLLLLLLPNTLWRSGNRPGCRLASV